MTLLKGFVLNIILFLLFDFVWMEAVAGDFLQQQLSEVAKITEDGNWDVRMGPAIMVYILMAFAIELFIFRNPKNQTGKDYLVQGALLGFTTFGVFDLTNRAIIDQYPLAMVIVDMGWGTFLFASVSYLSFLIKEEVRDIIQKDVDRDLKDLRTDFVPTSDENDADVDKYINESLEPDDTLLKSLKSKVDAYKKRKKGESSRPKKPKMNSEDADQIEQFMKNQNGEKQEQSGELDDN
ncbi:MAG: DUF2177 family protein, partial [Pseudomonadota bacterium]